MERDTSGESSASPRKSQMYTNHDTLPPVDVEEGDSDKSLSPELANSRRRLKTVHKHTLWVLFIILCFLPAILLAVLTVPLSEHVGRTGCSCGGDFVIPYTTSIWDTNLFFIPSLSFNLGTGRGQWSSLTVARVIDIGWDLAIARGSQVLLAWLAYQVFRRVFEAQMQAGEVGYDVFSEVTSHTSQVRSLAGLWRRSFGKLKLPRANGTRTVYGGMTLVTVYILAVPTFFAAMTGYISNCAGPLLSAFGVIEIKCLAGFNYSDSTYRDDRCNTDYLGQLGRFIPDFSPVSYNSPPWTCGSFDYMDYYNRYRQSYEECERVGSSSAGHAARAGCAALDVESVIYLQCSDKGDQVRLQPPLLNLTIFDDYRGDGKTKNGDRHYNRFDCGERLMQRDWLGNDRSAVVPGSCTAFGAYAWGFSFHFMFLVSILSAIVALILYSLWLYALRLAPKEMDTNTFLDAALMISRAQQQFGSDVHGWTAKRVEKVILKGGQGIGDPPAYLRLRNVR